jgi:hypothetical protein
MVAFLLWVILPTPEVCCLFPWAPTPVAPSAVVGGMNNLHSKTKMAIWVNSTSSRNAGCSGVSPRNYRTSPHLEASHLNLEGGLSSSNAHKR